MLKLTDVHTYYGDSHILHGISMDIPKGSLVAMLGRNGMGKTTTLHSIIGFTPPSKGDILLDGINIAGQPAYRIVQMGAALVPQGRRIFRSLTVFENLMIGAASGKEKERVELTEVYDMFPVLKYKSRHQGDELSGGEQQMLAIGRALMTNPKLILMDEPFEGLAPAIIKEIRQRILELKEKGLTVLLVEQNVKAAIGIADYIYVLNKGRIAASGPSGDFKSGEKLADCHI